MEKKRRLGRVVEILVHLIFGTMAALARALRLSKVSRRVNVSFLERYNATDRHKNARKVRKTYTFSKDWRVHESMTYFTMYSYNFCWAVRTLEDRDEDGRVRQRGRRRWRRGWPTTSGRCVSGSRCPLFNALRTRPKILIGSHSIMAWSPLATPSVNLDDPSFRGNETIPLLLGS